MNSFFPGNSMKNISNGHIDNILSDNNTTYITISFTDCFVCQNSRQVLVLVVEDSTLVFDSLGNIIPVYKLETGMFINATISSAMTKSMPPQAFAYIIRIVYKIPK